jgi:hypothetical protein
MSDIKQFTGISGNKIWINTSDEACAKLGFKHKDRVQHRIRGSGTFIGVPTHEIAMNNPSSVYVAIDVDNEKVSLCDIESLSPLQNQR